MKQLPYKSAVRASLIACFLGLTACQGALQNTSIPEKDFKPLARLDSPDWKQLPYQTPAVYWDSEAFIERASSVLPKYRVLFEKASDHIETDEINWRLLAAISYQESHWVPYARSSTGVRGMMMLTRQTARAMGVSDRVDPKQSIYGGARYMQFLLDNLPNQIRPQSRLPFALASYNMGPGYVLAARQITRRQGADHNSWPEVKKRLHHMGVSRAYQATSFVRRTLRYYQLLNWLNAQDESPQSAITSS